jgi:hypothetical protein
MSDKQATQEAQLLLGQLLFGKQMTYCLSGVARLGVADLMNATPMAVEEIAGNARTDRSRRQSEHHRLKPPGTHAPH